MTIRKQIKADRKQGMSLYAPLLKEEVAITRISDVLHFVQGFTQKMQSYSTVHVMNP